MHFRAGFLQVKGSQGKWYDSCVICLFRSMLTFYTLHSKQCDQYLNPKLTVFCLTNVKSKITSPTCIGEQEDSHRTGALCNTSNIQSGRISITLICNFSNIHDTLSLSDNGGNAILDRLKILTTFCYQKMNIEI